jgi:hypothetical protein
MRLRDWQEQLQCAVLAGGDRVELRLRETGLARKQGIDIYANAYAVRLRDALQSNYEALHRLLGDEDFAAMADRFADAVPPSTVSIRWHGDGLAEFLAATEPYRSCPAISELARFEWALRHTVDAADAVRIDTDALQALAPEQWPELRCGLHPSLSILRFEWNAPQIWRALDADEEPPQPVRNDCYWLIHRDRELVANWRSADETEVAMLQLWGSGANFGALCTELEKRLSDPDSAAIAAVRFLRMWLDHGLLTHPLE